jgi:stage II sporulation protein AA (anti-sigma F factor antagonist)
VTSCRHGVLVVRGELDCATGPALAAQLAADASITAIDLSGVTFIDPSGLAALDAARDRDGHGPELRAVAPCVGRLIELAGVTGRFRLSRRRDARAAPALPARPAGQRRRRVGCRPAAR